MECGRNHEGMCVGDEENLNREFRRKSRFGCVSGRTDAGLRGTVSGENHDSDSAEWRGGGGALKTGPDAPRMADAQKTQTSIG